MTANAPQALGAALPQHGAGPLPPPHPGVLLRAALLLEGDAARGLGPLLGRGRRRQAMPVKSCSGRLLCKVKPRLELRPFSNPFPQTTSRQRQQPCEL